MATKADINYRSYAGQRGLRIVGEVIDPRREGKDPSKFDDIFKLSDVQDGVFGNLAIRGGTNREDGVDINNLCRNICFYSCEVEAGNKYAFTIKGGSELVILSDILITKPGPWVDIDIGNWSDQSMAPTRRVILRNVARKDGRPVRVRVGCADWPDIEGGNVDILRVQSALLKVYVQAKLRLQ